MTTGPGDLPPVPLARLFAMAGRYLVERLHQRLADRGWPDIPRPRATSCWPPGRDRPPAARSPS
ncbi:hypothetical protein [Dactylosporangium cerinum]